MATIIVTVLVLVLVYRTFCNTVCIYGHANKADCCCCCCYPIGLISSTIDMFIQNIATKPEKKTDDGNTIRIVLPFKDQIAANAVRRQLRGLSSKISVTLQPIFVSKKLEQDLKPKEIKPSILSRHALFINLHVICVMQIMSVIQPDTI